MHVCEVALPASQFPEMIVHTAGDQNKSDEAGVRSLKGQTYYSWPPSKLSPAPLKVSLIRLAHVVTKRHFKV